MYQRFFFETLTYEKKNFKHMEKSKIVLKCAKKCGRIKLEFGHFVLGPVDGRFVIRMLFWYTKVTK